MKRKLFCEISPLTYRISTKKEILMRKIRDLPLRGKFARIKQEELLPVRIKKHASLIRRRLGNVDMQLQENKAGRSLPSGRWWAIPQPGVGSGTAW